LFDEPTMRRFADHYTHLLTTLTQHPDQPISRLEFITPRERLTLLPAWNDTDRPAPDRSVAEWFEDQVRRSPDAVALVHEETRLTYRELNRRANRLAHRLRRLGAGPETVVALLLPRGIDHLVALLAVLKAGAGYLPLDPGHPDERLAYTLSDAGARFVVAAAAHAARVPDGIQAVVFDPSAVQDEPVEDPTPSATPDNLCYVIYTSGSTGRPKGVAMPHRPLVNLMDWQLRRSGLTGPTLHFSAINFDVAFQEIFATLLSGRQLVLIDEEQRRDPEQVLDAVRRFGVERLFCPPMVLEQLAAYAGSTGAGLSGLPLKEIITAGERLTLGHETVAFLAGLPEVVLENHCGPTETHVVTAHALRGRPADWPQIPPIGSPVDNARIHLLDEQLRQVPIGVPGEMYASLAWDSRGYLGRPDLTAERFLPDPFSPRPGRRMYRTGDRARWREDGTLEFLGRVDDQVKIRGYRVEPGEIQSRLTTHPEVAEAAVLTVENAGERRLAAFVTAVAEGTVEPDELRAFLSEVLPDYMVPSSIDVLPALPLTRTGKLDRAALRALTTTGRQTRSTYCAPRNARESLLADIWSAAMGIPRIGVYDDFFELGGHSLLATRVVARIRGECGVDLPLRALFTHRTIAELAPVIDRTGAIEQAPLVRRGKGEGPAPLSYAQERLWFQEQLHPDT
ncbi:amino acid adenylation domain-containing protein, partial [Streptomyces sp. NPDC050759]|uniref:amino acid adenylation domain-containing protein n=1 Tax=Streptomyces sp. NPDC050759 TaxID=3365635 RepID=UPI0037A2758F